MSEILNAVRSVVGRRSRITSAEMAEILATWEPDLLPEASTICGRDASGRLYAGPRIVESSTDETAATARQWAEMCRGICCVSVFDADTGGSGSPPVVRYDEPGAMHPMQYAHAAFVPEDCSGDECDTIGYMRRHAARVLVVMNRR
jgi:hypothetical protein